MTTIASTIKTLVLTAANVVVTFFCIKFGAAGGLFLGGLLAMLVFGKDAMTAMVLLGGIGAVIGGIAGFIFSGFFDLLVSNQSLTTQITPPKAQPRSPRPPRARPRSQTQLRASRQARGLGQERKSPLWHPLPSDPAAWEPWRRQ